MQKDRERGPQQGSALQQTPGQSRQPAQQKATDVAERVADKAQSTFASAKDKVTDGLNAVARAISSAAETLQEKQQGAMSKKVEPYVQKAENASRYLQDKSPRELKSDLDGFARRRPAWYLGGAFVVGLMGARFLKSSEPGAGAGGARSGEGAMRHG